MCRMIAIPGGMSRNEAIDILLNMMKQNVHGTGCGWVDSNGKFQIQKYPLPLTTVLKRKVKFLDHLPHTSWTIVHMRLASCGSVEYKNCHPFNINDKMIGCHNGCFSPWRIPKMLIEKFEDFSSTTDTEVALRMINLLGYQQCLNEFNNDGCFFCLTKHGVLNVLKTSNDLQIVKFGESPEGKDTYVLSSELAKSKYPNRMDGKNGWYKFNPDCTFKKFEKQEFGYSFQRQIDNKEDTTVYDVPPMESPRLYVEDWSGNHGVHGQYRLPSSLPAIYHPKNEDNAHGKNWVD
jgi:predicted glutamine amidotransferase